MSANPPPAAGAPQYEPRIQNLENDLASTKVVMNTQHTSQETRLNLLQSIISKSEDRFVSFIKTIRKIPDEILIRSISATDSIAEKIDDYRKVMKGEKGDNGQKDEMFIVNEKHASLLNKLRKENTLMYCLLVQSADAIFPESLLNENIPYLKCKGTEPPVVLGDAKLQLIFVCNLLLLNAQSASLTSTSIQALKSQTEIFPTEDAINQWISANS